MKNYPARVFCYLVVMVAVLVVVVPLSLVVLMSLSDWSAFQKDVFSIFETGPQWQNFVEAWEVGKMGLYFKNTLIVLVMSLLMTNVSASLLAYSIKKFDTRFSNTMYYVVLAGMFIPVQALMLPLYNTMSALGLLNTYFGLALVYSGMGLPMATMLYAGFYRNLPKELLEAAEIDGCSSFGAYLKVALPLSKTIITTVSILSGLTIWKDFYINIIVVSDANMKLISTSMLAFVSEYTTNWSGVCAAMVVQSIPVIALYLLLQKQFVNGITAGAVKG
ncbi:MAG: carbohydrate ABC transporter permease [Oscillospiraceae bacterium]|nr:carbohydrate ABC transporter permease [Oscillospiraceae bacterium]